MLQLSFASITQLPELSSLYLPHTSSDVSLTHLPQGKHFIKLRKIPKVLGKLNSLAESLPFYLFPHLPFYQNCVSLVFSCLYLVSFFFYFFEKFLGLLPWNNSQIPFIRHTFGHMLFTIQHPFPHFPRHTAATFSSKPCVSG